MTVPEETRNGTASRHVERLWSVAIVSSLVWPFSFASSFRRWIRVWITRSDEAIWSLLALQEERISIEAEDSSISDSFPLPRRFTIAGIAPNLAIRFLLLLNDFGFHSAT